MERNMHYDKQYDRLIQNKVSFLISILDKLILFKEVFCWAAKFLVHISCPEYKCRQTHA